MQNIAIKEQSDINRKSVLGEQMEFFLNKCGGGVIVHSYKITLQYHYLLVFPSVSLKRILKLWIIKRMK